MPRRRRGRQANRDELGLLRARPFEQDLVGAGQRDDHRRNVPTASPIPTATPGTECEDGP